jgi:hypothetical protein
MAHSFSCWITKATDTHSEYVIFIAFPWQQCLRERASVLHYTRTYIACLVIFSLITDTRPEYLILTTFQRQQCVGERVSMFRYMYAPCLVMLLLIRNESTVLNRHTM